MMSLFNGDWFCFQIEWKSFSTKLSRVMQTQNKTERGKIIH